MAMKEETTERSMLISQPCLIRPTVPGSPACGSWAASPRTAAPAAPVIRFPFRTRAIP
ncbi:hypothetical protein GCM10018953_16310 [Streptosporangium nondiastaticum]